MMAGARYSDGPEGATIGALATLATSHARQFARPARQTLSCIHETSSPRSKLL